MRIYSPHCYSPASHAFNLGSFKILHWTESEASLRHRDNADLVRKLARGGHPAHKDYPLAIGREHACLRARGSTIVRARGKASGLTGRDLGNANAIVHYMRDLPAIGTPGEGRSYWPAVAGHLPQRPAAEIGRASCRERV